MHKPIPIIDLFAGPGGLGEGFTSVLDADNKRVFKIALSIEKDKHAHQTLTLRSFFRQFEPNCVPDDYYHFVKGEISLDELYEKWPLQAKLAKEEAWCATLGKPDAKDTNGVTDDEVDKRITEALNGETDWLLIGGPPCQAYSIVGRSRRQERVLDEAKDKRVGLYKEYLRILAFHNPAVFVMENVKGILSAKTNRAGVFAKILEDLSDPATAYLSDESYNKETWVCPGYKIYSLVTTPKDYDIFDKPVFTPKDFVIKAEDYGVPQKRHRVILLGIRNNILLEPSVLNKSKIVTLKSVIGNLPFIRSGINRTFTHSTEVLQNDVIKKKRHYQNVKDTFEKWVNLIDGFNKSFKEYFENETLVYLKN